MATRTISRVIVPSLAAILLLPVNAERSAAHLYIEEGGTLYLGDDSGVTPDTGWPYQNGDQVPDLLASTGELWGICSSGDKDVRLIDVSGEIPGSGGGGGDPVTPATIDAAIHRRMFHTAAYQGTYDSETTYVYGYAVRANNDGTWQLYVSVANDNTGNDPTVDDGSNWLDTVDDGQPVAAQGSANPNTDGEQNRVTHYTQDAAGGTFDLGTATGIAFDADLATIQTALDGAYGVSKTTVGGTDASDFTVNHYGDALAFDGTNLTGGGLTLQDDTQALVTGGFVAPAATVYLQAAGDNGSGGALWNYNPDSQAWEAGIRARREAASDGDSYSDSQVTRSGSGNGNADGSQTSRREDSGNGDADLRRYATRAGSGNGDATFEDIASVTNSAIGTANASRTASHHTGGGAVLTLLANADGAIFGLSAGGKVIEIVGDDLHVGNDDGDLLLTADGAVRINGTEVVTPGVRRTGTAIITALNTAVTVTHGCTNTPTAVDISVLLTNLTTAAIGAVYVNNIDTDTFDINVALAPGVSTAIFAWQCWDHA